MAHLIKMLMKTTTVPTKFRQRCCATRLLTTSYFLNCMDFTHARTRIDTSYCISESGVNVDEEQQSENREGSGEKHRKTKSMAVRLKQSTLRKVRSVVGISVTPYAVGWAKMDVKEMRLEACFSENLNTVGMDITESLACRMMKDIVQHIPKSDVYIMESCRIFLKQFKEMRTNEVQTMLSSMLAIQLYDPHGPLGEENVFFQKKSVIDRLYKLNVRWERVSAGQALQRLLGSTVAEEVSERKDNIILTVKGITLSTTSKNMHGIFSSSPAIRDACAVAFFVALSFVQANLKSLYKIDRELPTSDVNLD